MATVIAYDKTLHKGRASETHCAQGGTECPRDAQFSVIGPVQKISACPRHLAGAVREADGMPARAWT